MNGEVRAVQQNSGRLEERQNELELKYGCNPNQKPARVFMKNGAALPFTVLNGKPGYINLLDAFNSWQLVRGPKATGPSTAASAKHVSPAGALPSACRSTRWTAHLLCPDLRGSADPTAAYAPIHPQRPAVSFGDWAALSDVT